ncbi:protein NETWORKED 3A-like [Prosopis cineraria]|uniref:protein NETWORKED 3A-like n=1 Tax=Prosopis cineraria TaxID=364024 RepID=UPI00240EF625|nr:protein NETWORKED 3A-like [Prosopis cineraria]XP_054776632.1 protein NETWORKED 3A-like [Prosopis cineraria]
MTKDQPLYWWLLDNHSTIRQSPWLQSTLAELNEKTRTILELIEEDADSFAQRAEMYYKKRPELIRMVEDFYRTQRSLAERYDQVKSDTGIRLLTTEVSPFSPTKYQSDNIMGFKDRSYDSYSENCDAEESVESEIDDSELKLTTKFAEEDEVMKLKEEIQSLREENRAYKDQLNQKDAINDEVIILKELVGGLREENRAFEVQLKLKDALGSEVKILREDIKRCREENRGQRDQLKEKDEEKIKVIRHLSLAIDLLREENAKMRNYIAKDYNKKWRNPFELSKLKGALSWKLFDVRRNSSTVAT